MLLDKLLEWATDYRPRKWVQQKPPSAIAKRIRKALLLQFHIYSNFSKRI